MTDRNVDEEIGTIRRFEGDLDDILPQVMGFGRGSAQSLSFKLAELCSSFLYSEQRTTLIHRVGGVSVSTHHQKQEQSYIFT